MTITQYLQRFPNLVLGPQEVDILVFALTLYSWLKFKNAWWLVESAVVVASLKIQNVHLLGSRGLSLFNPGLELTGRAQL